MRSIPMCAACALSVVVVPIKVEQRLPPVRCHGCGRELDLSALTASKK